jgi:hypothetical protein
VTLTGSTLGTPATANAVTATFTVIVVSADRTSTLTTGTAAGDTTLTDVKPTNRPNVSGVYTVGFKAAMEATAVNGTLKGTVRAVLSRPAGSTATVTLALNAGTSTGFEELAIGGTGTNALTLTGDADGNVAVGASGTTLVANSLQVDATVNVDVVGTYSVLYFVDLNNNSAIDTGEAYYSQTISVVADAPALAITVYGATTVAETPAANKGALVKFTLTNGGAATSLSGTELISLSGITTFATGGTSSKTSLTRADFDADGVAYIQAQTATAGAYVLTVQGVGGGVASILKTTAITTKTPTGQGASQEITSFAKTNLTGVGTNVDDDTIKYAATTTVTYKATGALTAGATTYEATDVLIVRIADTDGTVTGKSSLGYVEAVTLGADATATVSVTFASSTTKGTAPTAGTVDAIGSVTLDDTTDNVKTVSTALALGKGFTVSPNATVRAKTASTISTTTTLKDQFGIVLPNVAVTATLASGSRNSGVVVVQNLVTNASGQVTFSYTDAPLAANAALTTDTWAIATASQAVAADGGVYAAGALTVTFAATLGITKVVVDTPNTTAGVANPTVVNTGINAGSSGASATTATVTATVTDASGSIVVGVPVTFTISGTTAAVTSTTVTSYTGSTGIATAKVYGWATGSYTVTATADGISGTGSVSFAQEDPTNARNVSATAQGAIVTALVKDRFGNPVKGVMIYATKTGTGYFGNGLSSTSGTTNSAGIVEFNVAGGEAVVTVSAVDPSAAAGTTYGQTCAAVGFTSCASTATAIKAATVGTSLLDETFVGSSFAEAGNASATVTAASDNSAQTAADAAAEATDAANAATDAANAAAEAADAATAAAQDAADAVAALSTQVSEMVNALKKQITSLTNLVIKIQKKVKA